MSGTTTQDPLLKSVGPFSYSDKRTLSFDFAALLLTGESINPSTVSVAGNGFTCGAPQVSGTQVVFQATAPSVAGSYVISATIDTQGLSTTQHLTRSATAFVFQR